METLFLNAIDCNRFEGLLDWSKVLKLSSEWAQQRIACEKKVRGAKQKLLGNCFFFALIISGLIEGSVLYYKHSIG